MLQLIKFICSLITVLVFNTNTSGKALVQNEMVNTANWHHENYSKENHIGKALHLNIGKTNK